MSLFKRAGGFVSKIGKPFRQARNLGKAGRRKKDNFKRRKGPRFSIKTSDR